MTVDPLAGSSWSAPAMVAGFAQSPPNDVLLAFAAREIARSLTGTAIDIGCGAGRNALPLARLGWRVIGTDLSWPMAAKAAERAATERLAARFQVVLAPMPSLPLANRSADLIVAHGIWNLARSASEFRSAVDEAARVARPGAALFVFTFSRQTLPADVRPVAGEPFVFTQFSGEPQCFLTQAQLVGELARAGFHLDPAVPLRELNIPKPGHVPASRAPVIFEALFRLSHKDS